MSITTVTDRGASTRPDDNDWRGLAACREVDVDPEMFFATAYTWDNAPNEARAAAAKEVCRRCRVSQQCLEWALAVDMPYAIAGGLTDTERRGLTDTRVGRPRGSAAPHGTAAAYRAHGRAGEAPCSDCRAWCRGDAVTRRTARRQTVAS